MIPMRTDPDTIRALPIRYILGDEEILARIPMQKPFVPFSDRTLDLLAALSASLRTREEVRTMPDAAAFAFWCRRAALEGLKKQYCRGRGRRIGRGVSLHFTPSNMPVLFAFSMCAGLLAGCSVIIRLSRSSSPEEELICRALAELLDSDFADFRPRIVFCRYEHDRAVTDLLCSLCDVRVMWGSDESVQEIRRSPLPPRGIDLPFAARTSAAVISAEGLLKSGSLDLLARDFYNDTFLTDQNACSSPRLIYWLGSRQDTDRARDLFWTALEEEVARRDYHVQAQTAIRKLEAALCLAAVCGADQIQGPGSTLVRVQAAKLTEDIWDYTAPGGFFVESSGEDLRGLEPVLGGCCQTIVVVGTDPGRVADLVVREGLRGVDRIVPAGHTLDFALTWDGIDMIGAMSRQISLPGGNVL